MRKQSFKRGKLEQYLPPSAPWITSPASTPSWKSTGFALSSLNRFHHPCTFGRQLWDSLDLDRAICQSVENQDPSIFLLCDDTTLPHTKMRITISPMQSVELDQLTSSSMRRIFAIASGDASAVIDFARNFGCFVHFACRNFLAKQRFCHQRRSHFTPTFVFDFTR